MMGLSDERPPTWRSWLLVAAVDAASVTPLACWSVLPTDARIVAPLALLPGIFTSVFTFATWLVFTRSARIVHWTREPVVEREKASV